MKYIGGQILTLRTKTDAWNRLKQIQGLVRIMDTTTNLCNRILVDAVLQPEVLYKEITTCRYYQDQSYQFVRSLPICQSADTLAAFALWQTWMQGDFNLRAFSEPTADPTVDPTADPSANPTEPTKEGRHLIVKSIQNLECCLVAIHWSFDRCSTTHNGGGIQSHISGCDPHPLRNSNRRLVTRHHHTKVPFQRTLQKPSYQHPSAVRQTPPFIPRRRGASHSSREELLYQLWG